MIESIDLATIFQTNQFSSAPILKPAILPYLSDSALIYEVERGEFFLDDENWTSLPKLCEEAIRSWWQGQSWREGPLPNDHGISSAIFLHSARAWKFELGVGFRSNLEIFRCMVSCKHNRYYLLFRTDLFFHHGGSEHSQHSWKPVSRAAAPVQESNFVIKYSDITNITFCVLFQKYNFSTTVL